MNEYIEKSKSGLRIRYGMENKILAMHREAHEQLRQQAIQATAKKPETTIIVKGRRCDKALLQAQEINSIMAGKEPWEGAWGWVEHLIHRFGYYRKEEALALMLPLTRACVEPIWEQLCHSTEEMARQAFRQVWEAKKKEHKQAKGEDTMETKHKYKVGDKVRIVKEWPADDSACQNPFGRMDKWLGKTMTIETVLCTTEPAYTMQEDQGDPAPGCGWTWWENAIEGLAEDPAEQERIVITREGNITLARLFRGRKLIHRAEAICSPKDEYDFAVGAEIAFTRLQEKVDEERMEAERIKEGDKVKVIGNKIFRHHFAIVETVTVLQLCPSALLCESSAGLIQTVAHDDVEKEAAR